MLILDLLLYHFFPLPSEDCTQRFIKLSLSLIYIPKKVLNSPASFRRFLLFFFFKNKKKVTSKLMQEKCVFFTRFTPFNWMKSLSEQWLD